MDILYNDDLAGCDNIKDIVFDMCTDRYIGMRDNVECGLGDLDLLVAYLFCNNNFYGLVDEFGDCVALCEVYPAITETNGRKVHAKSLTIYTDKDSRGRGYAKQLTRYVIDKEEVEIYVCYKGNYRSKHLAESLGLVLETTDDKFLTYTTEYFKEALQS